MKGSALKHRRKRIGTVPLCQTRQGYATATKANKSGRGVGGSGIWSLPPKSHKRDFQAGAVPKPNSSLACAGEELSTGVRGVVF